MPAPSNVAVNASPFAMSSKFPHPFPPTLWIRPTSAFTKVTSVPGSTVVTLAEKQAPIIRTVVAFSPVASFCVTPLWQPPPASAAPGIPSTTIAVPANRQRSIPRFMPIPPRSPMPLLHRMGLGGSRGGDDPQDLGLRQRGLQAHRVQALAPQEDVALHANVHDALARQQLQQVRPPGPVVVDPVDGLEPEHARVLEELLRGLVRVARE